MNFSKKIFFVLLFGFITLVGSQINFSAIVGAENQAFTLFQFFGPIAGILICDYFTMLNGFMSLVCKAVLKETSA